MKKTKRTGLGRGLSSLIPDSALDAGAEDGDRASMRVVPLDEIRPNPEQPRERFEPSELEALAVSIGAHGVMSPLLVRKEGGHYVLIAGERRLRAAGLAGLTEVPVIVRDAPDAATQLELALVENLLRSDLDPVEAARGYKRLIEQYGYTQEEVARRVGRERPTVANAIRLLKLPAFALDAVQNGQISAGHGRTLLPLAGTEDDLRRTLARLVSSDWSVRRTEQVVSQLTRVDGTGRSTDNLRNDRSMEYATRSLTDALQTSVVIKPRKRGGGRIVIDYASSEDLERLIHKLRGDA